MATEQVVTIFGGAGFIGTQLVQAFARKGYRIRVAVRRPDLAGHTKIHGGVGQIVPIQANIRNAESIARAVAGASIVINLVGIGDEAGKQTFAAIHVDGARAVAQAAKATGARAMVQMSALGVDKVTTSDYARSKLAGEEAVLAAFPGAVILRPSIVFGPGDGFFNLMGSLAQLSPIMPLIGGSSRFQPVYVGDVADAFVLAAEGAVKGGRVYELGGPDVVTHKELLQRILTETGRRRLLLPLPEAIAKLLAIPAGLIPGPKLLTADKVELLSADNVVSPEAVRDKRSLAGFGISPTSMATILPTYMWRFRKNGQFDRFGDDTHSASSGTTL